MERTTVPFANDQSLNWKSEVIDLLWRVIAADQVLDHNNTMQDTRHDGLLAQQARSLIDRAT